MQYREIFGTTRTSLGNGEGRGRRSALIISSDLFIKHTSYSHPINMIIIAYINLKNTPSHHPLLTSYAQQ